MRVAENQDVGRIEFGVEGGTVDGDPVSELEQSSGELSAVDSVFPAAADGAEIAVGGPVVGVVVAVENGVRGCPGAGEDGEDGRRGEATGEKVSHGGLS